MAKPSFRRRARAAEQDVCGGKREADPLNVLTLVDPIAPGSKVLRVFFFFLNHALKIFILVVFKALGHAEQNMSFSDACNT